MTNIFVVEDQLTESNCYLLEEECKVIIIDPNNGEKILSILKEHQWELDYILLTHEHCDHIQGLNKVRENFDVKVIAQEKCSKNLGNPVKNMSGMMETYLYFKSGETKTFHYKPLTCKCADIVFEKSYTLMWRNHEFKMESVPGHTEGSSAIWMDDKRLFSGDYLILGEEDLTGFPGGSKEDYLNYTKKWIDQLPSGLEICPGHGERYRL